MIHCTLFRLIEDLTYIYLYLSLNFYFIFQVDVTDEISKLWRAEALKNLRGPLFLFLLTQNNFVEPCSMFLSGYLSKNFQNIKLK